MPSNTPYNLLQKDTKSIDMINKKNMGYEGEFWFGHPTQRMQVIFDTGSAWVWLLSEGCQNGQCPPKNDKYKMSKSDQYHAV
jgi:hypothetical protein